MDKNNNETTYSDNENIINNEVGFDKFSDVSFEKEQSQKDPHWKPKKSSSKKYLVINNKDINDKKLDLSQQQQKSLKDLAKAITGEIKKQLSLSDKNFYGQLINNIETQYQETEDKIQAYELMLKKNIDTGDQQHSVLLKALEEYKRACEELLQQEIKIDTSSEAQNNLIFTLITELSPPEFDNFIKLGSRNLSKDEENWCLSFLYEPKNQSNIQKTDNLNRTPLKTETEVKAEEISVKKEDISSANMSKPTAPNISLADLSRCNSQTQSSRKLSVATHSIFNSPKVKKMGATRMKATAITGLMLGLGAVAFLFTPAISISLTVSLVISAAIISGLILMYKPSKSGDDNSKLASNKETHHGT